MNRTLEQVQWLYMLLLLLSWKRFQAVLLNYSMIYFGTLLIDRTWCPSYFHLAILMTYECQNVMCYTKGYVVQWIRDVLETSPSNFFITNRRCRVNSFGSQFTNLTTSSQIYQRVDHLPFRSVIYTTTKRE